jgi:hypothetical protein
MALRGWRWEGMVQMQTIVIIEGGSGSWGVPCATILIL